MQDEGKLILARLRGAMQEKLVKKMDDNSESNLSRTASPEKLTKQLTSMGLFKNQKSDLMTSSSPLKIESKS